MTGPTDGWIRKPQKRMMKFLVLVCTNDEPAPLLKKASED